MNNAGSPPETIYAYNNPQDPNFTCTSLCCLLCNCPVPGVTFLCQGTSQKESVLDVCHHINEVLLSKPADKLPTGRGRALPVGVLFVVPKHPVGDLDLRREQHHTRWGHQHPPHLMAVDWHAADKPQIVSKSAVVHWIPHLAFWVQISLRNPSGKPCFCRNAASSSNWKCSCCSHSNRVNI